MRTRILKISTFAVILIFALTVAATAQLNSISGTVTDAETGRPIVAAQVGAINMDSMTTAEATTDSTGYYFIDGLTSGFHIVGASKEAYEDGIYDGLVELGTDEHLTDIDIQLFYVGGTGIGAISGQVVDSESGLPLADAIIDISGLPGIWYTDSEGNYLCDSIPDGFYVVSSGKEDYFPETYPDTVVVAIDETTTGVNFDLTPFGEPGSISGTVTDLATGLPIENVYISASGHFSNGYDWTDGDGHYSIPDLIRGDYTVNAWSETYWEKDYPGLVTVSAGENTPGIDFVLTPHGGPDDGVIAGKVLEEGTNAPLPMTLVIAYSENDNFDGAFTDETGSYYIQGLPTDQYYVIAFQQDYVVELYDGVYNWEDATPVLPDAYDIDFYLTPGDSGSATVTGLVSSDGAPVEDAIVCAEQNGEVKSSAMTDADGAYEISGLSPGDYTVSASMVSYYAAAYPSQLHVDGEAVDDINIELEPFTGCDPNGDGVTSITDAVFLVTYIFAGGNAPDPLESGDINCDGVVNISDAVYVIMYIFASGPAPCANC